MTTRVAPKTGEKVERDPRRLFSPKQRLQILLASNGRCAKCGEKLGKEWEADHILPHALGGRTEVGNGEAICVQPCHSVKSKKDVKSIAKAKRLAGETCTSSAGRKLESRGFDQTKTRGFDGKVRKRRGHPASKGAAETEGEGLRAANKGFAPTRGERV